MEKISKLKFKINKLYYFLFKERFNKKINFDFPLNKNRLDFIQRIIDKKNFNSYLEIGCDDDNLIQFLEETLKVLVMNSFFKIVYILIVFLSMGCMSIIKFIKTYLMQ